MRDPVFTQAIKDCRARLRKLAQQFASDRERRLEREDLMTVTLTTDQRRARRERLDRVREGATQ